MGRRYEACSGSDRFFLKVRSEWWPVARAELVCGIIQQLSAQGFPVPKLRLTAKGKPFALWESHICECHEFVEGQPLALNEIDLVGEAGRLLAMLHPALEPLASDGNHLMEGCGFPHPRHAGFFADRVRDLATGDDAAKRSLDHVVAKLAELFRETREARVQTIHGDYHPGNLIVAEGRINAVCDFDLAQPTPVAYDLGYFLYRSAGKPGRAQGGVSRVDHTVADAFLYGYADSGSAHEISRVEIAREFHRFALYDCLLEANNRGDAAVLQSRAADVDELERDLERWILTADCLTIALVVSDLDRARCLARRSKRPCRSRDAAHLGDRRARMCNARFSRQRESSKLASRSSRPIFGAGTLIMISATHLFLELLDARLPSLRRTARQGMECAIT